MAITPRRPAAAAVQKIKFLDMGAYTGGNFDLPEGPYVIFFDFRFHAYTKQDGTKGQENLGTMLTCYPILGDGSVGEPLEHFLSLGRKAKDAVMPNADDGGESLVALPGGTGTLSRNTNSQLFFKSMMDAGMPPELASVEDLTDIDGVWVVTKNIAEPEERKGYGKAGTGEVEEQQRNQTPQKIPTVVEILDGGAPWEGGGGLPEEKPKSKVAPKAAPKAAAPARPAIRKPAPEPEPEEEESSVDMADAIKEAIGAVLSLPANAKGIARVTLRMNAFKEIKKTAGEEGQQALAAMFEENPDDVELLLGELGYKVVGTNVKPA